MANEIRANIKVSQELKNLIKDNEEIAPKAIKLGMRNITRKAPAKVRKKIRSLGLIGKRKMLIKSIRGKTTKDKSIIGSRYFVGHILEGGAQPHIIKARKGKTLWFPGLKAPAKKIRHPGVRPYKFLESTIDEMEASRELESLFSQGVRQAIEAVQNGG